MSKEKHPPISGTTPIETLAVTYAAKKRGIIYSDFVKTTGITLSLGPSVAATPQLTTHRSRSFRYHLARLESINKISGHHRARRIYLLCSSASICGSIKMQLNSRGDCGCWRGAVLKRNAFCFTQPPGWLNCVGGATVGAPNHHHVHLSLSTSVSIPS